MNARSGSFIHLEAYGGASAKAIRTQHHDLEVNCLSNHIKALTIANVEPIQWQQLIHPWWKIEIGEIMTWLVQEEKREKMDRKGKETKQIGGKIDWNHRVKGEEEIKWIF